jgi:hypothetical protein
MRGLVPLRSLQRRAFSQSRRRSWFRRAGTNDIDDGERSESLLEVMAAAGEGEQHHGVAHSDY